MRSEGFALGAAARIKTMANAAKQDPAAGVVKRHLCALNGRPMGLDASIGRGRR
jgi:hypothetical protein